MTIAFFFTFLTAVLNKLLIKLKKYIKFNSCFLKYWIIINSVKNEQNHFGLF